MRTENSAERDRKPTETWGCGTLTSVLGNHGKIRTHLQS